MQTSISGHHYLGKVFENGQNKICQKHPLKNSSTSNFSKAAFNKFYLVQSRIRCLKYKTEIFQQICRCFLGTVFHMEYGIKHNTLLNILSSA